MKKYLSLMCLVLACTIVFASCTPPLDDSLLDLGDATIKSEEAEDESVQLVLWGAVEDYDMLVGLMTKFHAENPNINVEVRSIGEDKAKDTALGDLENTADVFAIAHDQLGELVEVGAVFPVSVLYAQNILDENTQAAIQAATSRSVLYGFPFSADTYVMYYRSDIFSNDDVGSLDAMLLKAEEAGIPIGFDMANSYFSASFYLSNNVKLFGDSGDDANGSTFHSDESIKTAEYIASLKDRGMINMTDGDAEKAFEDGEISAFVSGPWRTNQFKSALGANYGVAKLPMVQIDGSERQMVSFAGYKLYVVKSSTMYPNESMELARFLSAEESQLERFASRSLLPSNSNAGRNSELMSDQTVAAIIMQLNNAISMPSIPEISNFWAEEAMNLTLKIFEGEIEESDFPDIFMEYNKKLSNVVVKN